MQKLASVAKKWNERILFFAEASSCAKVVINKQCAESSGLSHVGGRNGFFYERGRRTLNYDLVLLRRSWRCLEMGAERTRDEMWEKALCYVCDDISSNFFVTLGRRIPFVAFVHLIRDFVSDVLASIKECNICLILKVKSKYTANFTHCVYSNV